jgi:hypothetical protein
MIEVSSSRNIVEAIKRRMRWARYIAGIEEMRNEYCLLV